MLDEEKTRIMVNEQGITLQETNRFFQEKIDEYNRLITLKHLADRKQTPLTQQQEMKRYTGDQGKITNYHFVLNWRNLNLVFQELQKQEESPKQKSNGLLKKKTQMHLKGNLERIPEMKKKLNNNSLYMRLESKLNDMDSKMSTIQTQTLNSRKLSMNADTPLKGQIQKSIELKKSEKNYQYQHYLNQSRQRSKSTVYKPIDTSQQQSELIKSLIHESFHSNTFRPQTPEKKIIYDLPIFKDKPEQLDMKMLDYDKIQPYEQFKNRVTVDVDKMLQNSRRRQNIIQSIKQKREPKYLHLGGSKFSVQNNLVNQRNYYEKKAKILRGQLLEELNKLRSRSNVDHFELKDLEGPPIKVEYQSSNLRQDYDDVKVTKILKKLILDNQRI